MPGTSTSADLSPFTRSVRVLCSAGAKPQRSALTTDNTRLASSTACPSETGSRPASQSSSTDALIRVEPLHDAVADGDPGQPTQERQNQAFGQQQPD